MEDFTKIENYIHDFYTHGLQTIDTKNTYLKYWLNIMRDYPIAVVKLRLREPKANLFAAKVMRDAIRFQMTEAVLAIAMEFPSYQIYNGHPNQIESYFNIINRYQKIYNAELIAKTYSGKVNKNFIRKVKSEKLLEQLDTYLSELTLFAGRINSFMFQMYYYELKLKRCQILKDQRGIMATCEEALSKFKEKRFKVSPQLLFAFTYPQFSILIQRKEFGKVKPIIKKWSRILKEKNNNWFVVHSFNVILNFRMANFARVRKLLKEVEDYPTSLVAERYYLFEAYSALFERKKLSITRFINDVYEHQKDKGGYNIPIIIVQLLHLLKLGDDKSSIKYIESVEAIDRYLYRHIKEDRRSTIFLKMLLMIPKCDFSLEKYSVKTDYYLTELQNLPIEKYSSSVEIELIPYEVLNEEVKKYLK